MKYYSDELTVKHIIESINNEVRETAKQPDYIMLHPHNKRLATVDPFHWNTETNVFSFMEAAVIWDQVNVEPTK